jgi:hypothetical protein
VVELNSGQMSYVLNAKFNCHCASFTKVQGVPFTITEIEKAILEELEKVNREKSS